MKGEDEAFPHTRWSLVGRAGHPDARVQRAALTDLLRLYMPALKAYLVKARQVPPDEADDLLQGFLVSKVLEEQLVAGANEAQGRFRTFLLTALDRHMVNTHRYEQRHKRRAQGMQSMEGVAEPASPELEPSAIFDLAWARELLGEAVRQMEAECRRTDRADVWGVFDQRVLAEVRGDRPVLAYEDLVRRYGLKSPAHAANLLITGKRMLARMLRAVVSEYEADEKRIDEEIAELHRILARGR